MHPTDQSEQSIRQKIIDIVSNENGRPIPAGIILKKLGGNRIDYQQKKEIYNTIDNLVNQGTFKRLTKSNSIILGYTDAPIDETNLLDGTININLGGNGFITLINETKAKYFVHKMNLNGALNGDKVQFALMQKKPKADLIDAKVIKVISHDKDFYVGVFHLDKNGQYNIKVDDEKFYLTIKLDSIDGLVDGYKILIKIKTYEKDIAYGTVSKIIGHASDVGVDILSIVYDNGVEPDFSDEILQYVKNIKLDIDDNQRKIRKDLTNLPIVTIDPKTSKDFDDAIYVKKISDDKYYLSVSIADVSHYVRYKSILDEEALKRGCSIYLVDRVIPMLPHNLSDDICSLNPNVERLTLTCDMEIDFNGKMNNIHVYPSIIKSHRRFAYDDVNEYFNKTDNLEKDSEEVKHMLNEALELHKILDKAKLKRGYINFEIPEPMIVVNDKGFPIEIKKRESGIAQHMIEDFMVMANEAVTRYAQQKKWPFVYRLHDKPNEDRLKIFALEAKKLGFKINTDIKNIQPHHISQWIQDNQDNSNLDLINMMLLRTMAKAEYDIKNIGHFGLALEDYTHFTSPIRRYPDLMVHRIYWMLDFLKNTSETNKNQMADELKERSALSSKNELRAIKCERDVNAMKFAEYMTRHIGDEFDGTITNVSPFGVFVQLENIVEGLMKLSNLKNDFYTFNEKTNELIGRKSGMRFSLGTKVRVKVINANKETAKIEFELVKHLGNR